MRFTIHSRNQFKSNQMLVFTRRKTSRSRVENQQTQPTYDADSEFTDSWLLILQDRCSLFPPTTDEFFVSQVLFS